MSLSQDAERDLFSALGFSVAKEVITALNTGSGGTSAVLSSGSDATHLGFFGVTAVVRTGAFTQTYATASHTHSALTAAALTDSSGGAASGTLAAITAPAANATTSLTADMTAVKNAVASLAAQIAALIIDLTNTKQVLNAVVDDAQLYGLYQ